MPIWLLTSWELKGYCRGLLKFAKIGWGCSRPDSRGSLLLTAWHQKFPWRSPCVHRALMCIIWLGNTSSNLTITWITLHHHHLPTLSAPIMSRTAFGRKWYYARIQEMTSYKSDCCSCFHCWRSWHEYTFLYPSVSAFFCRLSSCYVFEARADSTYNCHFQRKKPWYFLLRFCKTKKHRENRLSMINLLEHCTDANIFIKKFQCFWAALMRAGVSLLKYNHWNNIVKRPPNSESLSKIPNFLLVCTAQAQHHQLACSCATTLIESGCNLICIAFDHFLISNVGTCSFWHASQEWTDVVEWKNSTLW